MQPFSHFHTEITKHICIHHNKTLISIHFNFIHLVLQPKIIDLRFNQKTRYTIKMM